MDIYVQMGVLFMFLTAFALVASVNAEVLDLAKVASNVVSQDSVNYHNESSVSTQRFIVDARNFKQWSMNASDQSDVYLYLPSVNSGSTFGNADYDAYRHQVDLTLDPQKINYSMKINNQTAVSARNSIKVTKGNWQSERAVEWYAKYAKTASNKRTLVVLAIPHETSGKLSYVVMWEGY